VYTIGKQRLFYISAISENKTVETEITGPSLKTYGRYNMTYINGGKFYIDITFMSQGSYIFEVFENGVFTHRDILKVDKGKYIVYPQDNDIIIEG